MVMVSMGHHVVRAPSWRSDGELFDQATRVLPGSSYAWHFLGVVQLHHGQESSAAESFGRAILGGHPHVLDREFRLEALVKAGRPVEALRWADSGGQENLTAGYLAWWAMAAQEAGSAERARELLLPLRRDQTWDGPDFVPGLAHDLGLASQ
jgi:hypothetical protein